MRRFLLAALIGMLIGTIALATDTIYKSQIGLQDLNLDTDNQGHATFQRRTSTSGTVTLDKIDGNGIPWSSAYTRTIRPLSITGNATGSITGYNFGSPTGYSDNGYFSTIVTKGPWVDARAWATGDGSTNDTTSFQSAATAAAGKVLYVPKGYTFYIDNVQISANTTVTGGGTLKKRPSSTGVLLNVTGDNVVVDGIVLDGSETQTGSNLDAIQSNYKKGRFTHNAINTVKKGSGIAVYGGRDNYIAGNKIYSAENNGIFVGDEGADNNVIVGNVIHTTSSQNCIFLTASSGSTNNGKYIYNNIVSNNVATNCYDSGIESGYHAVGTVISGNVVSNSTNPEILVRDNKYTVVTGNTIERGSNAGANTDGISILNHWESVPTWKSFVSVTGNVVRGTMKRSGIYLQHSYVHVEGNYVTESTETYLDNGAHLLGSGIAMSGTGENFVTITGNTIANTYYGINMNSGGSAVTDNNVYVTNNNIREVYRGISNASVTMNYGIIGYNYIQKVVSVAFHNTSAGGGGSTYLVNNLVAFGNWTGASPSAYTSTPDRTFLSDDGRIFRYGTAAPSTGTWWAGEVVINTGTDNVWGWKCTVSGTPGTWKAMQVVMP